MITHLEKFQREKKTDVYWKEDQYEWSDKEDKIKLHLVDYSWLKGLAHNSLKINRAKETRKIKYLNSEKGRLHTELEQQKEKLLNEVKRIDRILEYV